MRIQRTGFVDWQYGKLPPAEVRDVDTGEWLHDVVWAEMDRGVIMAWVIDGAGNVVVGADGSPQCRIENRQVEVHWND